MYFFNCYNSLDKIMLVDYFAMILIAIISTIFFVFSSYKLLQILQLSGYKIGQMFKWLKKTKFVYFSRLLMLSFLSCASMLITNVLMRDFFVVKSLEYFAFGFFILFASFFIVLLFSEKKKTPLKLTKRVVRLVVSLSIITFIFSVLIEFAGYMFVPYLAYGLIAIVPIFLPLLVSLAALINAPIEKIIYKSYIKKSKQKLETFKGIKVIGITGSYGKTSVKNILTKILSEKFKVCSTPENFNTPMGLSKTILENLREGDEILVAEMGARNLNDISELCEFVKPTIGVITGIGNQHLETFKSIENIIKTKAELAKYVTENHGKLFINVDSKNAKTLSESYKNAHLVSFLEQKDLIFDKIDISLSGTNFDIKYKEEIINVQYKLLGEHNLSNLYLAVSVAFGLGLSLDEIKSGIEKIECVQHRLQLIDSSNYKIIDDSYNCSVEGSKASLKFLKTCKISGNKIVITPGMVELGEEQFSANFEFGKDLANSCDYVIIDSNVNYDAIKNGLLEEKFDESKIIKTANLDEAVSKLAEIASKNDIVLFENDLPDNYS